MWTTIVTCTTDIDLSESVLVLAYMCSVVAMQADP